MKIFSPRFARLRGRSPVARLWPLAALGALWAGDGQEANAQAFCELRDPVRQIYELLPEATAHRSIVRTVDQASRDATTNALPFSIHFDELGRHTLYVGMKGLTPQALVHVRSEAGRWGLVEIAWAMDLDLRIRGFAFQRCRDTARRMVESPLIADQLRGKSFAELRAMLSSDGSQLSGEGLVLPANRTPEVDSLVVTTLRSALKTQVVTHTAWNSDLQTIRWIARGHAAFDAAVGVERVDTPWGSPWLVSAMEHAVGSETAIDRDQSVVLRVRDANEQILGALVSTPWRMDGLDVRVWWAVSNGGRIVDVSSVGGPQEIDEAFEALEGKNFIDFAHCSTAVELAGKEVSLLAAHHLGLSAAIERERARTEAHGAEGDSGWSSTLSGAAGT